MEFQHKVNHVSNSSGLISVWFWDENKTNQNKTKTNPNQTKQNYIHIICFTNISTPKMLNQHVTFWIDSPSERTEPDKLTVQRMYFPTQDYQGRVKQRCREHSWREQLMGLSWSSCSHGLLCSWSLSSGSVDDSFPFAEYTNFLK